MKERYHIADVHDNKCADVHVCIIADVIINIKVHKIHEDM